MDQSKQHEIDMKDYLDNEIGKIWLVLDMLCHEGRVAAPNTKLRLERKRDF